MILLIKELRDSENVVVKKIRCDNSGEKVAFQAAAKEEGLGLHFEFTARQTPQQNGRVERKVCHFVWKGPVDVKLSRTHWQA